MATGPGRLSYWRQGKYEVDFVVELDRQVFAVEVKSGRKKNAAGMGKFLSEHPTAHPVLITPENVRGLLEATEITADLLQSL